MFIRTLALAALVASALSPTARAADPAAPQEIDPKFRQRIYFTGGHGNGYSVDTEIEYTEDGAVVRFLGEVRLSARPMSEKEQGLRKEWIAGVPLGPDDEASERHQAIEKILARTRPGDVTNGLKPALDAAMEAWRSPMRFDAVWLDQNHPQAGGDAE